MLFFFVFAFQFMVTVIQAIGLNGSGTVGFITAMSQFNSTVVGWFVGIFCLSVAVAYSLCAAGNAVMIAKVSIFFTFFKLIFYGFMSIKFPFNGFLLLFISVLLCESSI
jgi:hypothetical protein